MLGLLFHLPRFFREYRLKRHQTLFQVINFLKTKENGISSYEEVRDHITTTAFMSLKKNFKNPMLTKAQ